MVLNAGLIGFCLWLWRTINEDNNATVLALDEASRRERQRLQQQLLAMVSDSTTAVTVAMGQDLDEEKPKAVTYMDDAAMADYEERLERTVLQNALDRGDE